MQQYCLDSWAILAFLHRENPAGLYVKQLLEKAAQENNETLFFSLMNLGEVYYIVGRASSREEADETIAQIRRLPLTIVSVDDEQIMAAARLKMSYRISYADAFALATAVRCKATLLTGDPELIALAPAFPIETLRRDG
jgi:uncharacterized protein